MLECLAMGLRGLLGQILLDAGIIGQETLDAALGRSARTEERLGEALVAMRAVSDDVLRSGAALHGDPAPSLLPNSAHSPLLEPARA